MAGCFTRESPFAKIWEFYILIKDVRAQKFPRTDVPRHVKRAH